MTTIIGAGLAGCECAYQLIKRGKRVKLIDMKPAQRTAAHRFDGFAELVCSNSLKGDSLGQASGLLKAEMRELDSLIISAADASRVRAGGALAVDRELFSITVQNRLKEFENLEILCQKVEKIGETAPGDALVIATGPLTDETLSLDIDQVIGHGMLSFFDAAAPTLSVDSIDFESAYYGDRYGVGDGDYVNCPMTKDEYLHFREELAKAQEVPLRGFEDSRVYEGCMPVEVLARRGIDTLRFGPLKPIGLRDPRTDKGAYAVAQLRRENAEGTMWGMVGFQTHLTFGEQKRVFSLIPALKNAEFYRYGVMHRNSFINAPQVLDATYQVIGRPGLYFAGQISGVEGYVESAASGMVTGIAIALGKNFQLPETTALAALSRHVSAKTGAPYQPIGINFGMIPKPENAPRDKKERYKLTSEIALNAIKEIKRGIIQ